MGQGSSSPSASSPERYSSDPSASPTACMLKSPHNQLLPAAAVHSKRHSRDKKRIGGLATLRRRLVRRRRPHKAQDHAKVIRDYIWDWPAGDVRALSEEYVALGLLKELSACASAARPAASSCQQDLCQLYRSRHCADAELLYQGCGFPVHRSILSARCPYFRKLLKECPRTAGGQIPVRIRTAGVDAALLNALLQYLYCGQLACCTAALSLPPAAVGAAGGGVAAVDPYARRRRQLAQLECEFGAPSPFERDMKYLLETADLADTLLVFRPGAGGSLTSPSGGPPLPSSVMSGCLEMSGPAVLSAGGSQHPFELPCHKAVLSARSPFFKAFIDRRMKTAAASGADVAGGSGVRAKAAPIRIELDEQVISRRYAYVLLRAMYMDSVDLALIMPGAQDAAGGAAAAGYPRHLDLVDEAIELYQIGRFVDLDVLTQASEDLIVDALCVENLPRVLLWSSEPHGSQWVHRQAVQFLCEEFGAVVSAPALLELSRSDLISAISCDFLQASELEVLQAILRWSEHQLVRLMEEREPNLLSHTAHSVARKGVKRRELSDVELRETMSTLLAHLRVDHLLPLDHETVTAAIRRGLISIPPSHMIAEDTSSRARSWLRCKRKRGDYVRPRYFHPYVEEVKIRSAVLESQLCGEYGGTGVYHHYQPYLAAATVPDALYMVDDGTVIGGAGAATDVTDAAQYVPVAPRADVMAAMLRRRREIQSVSLYQRAASCPLLRAAELRHQLNLQVVREFALPDCMTAALQDAVRHCDHQQLSLVQQPSASMRWRSASDLPHMLLPAVDPTQHFRTLDLEALNLGDDALLPAATVPDVALATGTLPRRRSLRAPAHQPDLGDGPPPAQQHHRRPNHH